MFGNTDPCVILDFHLLSAPESTLGNWKAFHTCAESPMFYRPLLITFMFLGNVFAEECSEESFLTGPRCMERGLRDEASLFGN